MKQKKKEEEEENELEMNKSIASGDAVKEKAEGDDKEKEKTDDEGEKTDGEEVKEEEEESEEPEEDEFLDKVHIWNAKVARFLAYVIDGGLLNSQFTMSAFIKMIDKVQDPKDEAMVNNEVCYLLHLRRKGKPYERGNDLPAKDIGKEMRDMIVDFKGYSFNSKVLIVLIETEYIQKKLNIISKSDYPKFLIEILVKSDRSILKECACRMIIKLFGKSKGDEGDGGGVDVGKIEFINLVEPLV